MMEEGIFQLILTQTGLAGIALFSMWQLRTTHEERLQREREISEIHRADRLELMVISKELVKTLSNLEHAVEALRDELHRPTR